MTQNNPHNEMPKDTVYLKTNCKGCGHFKDNHTYGETTDNPDKIGYCMERNCDCDYYISPTTPKGSLEELKHKAVWLALHGTNKELEDHITTAHNKGVEVGKVEEREENLKEIKCTQDIDGGVCDCCQTNYDHIYGK